MWVLITSTKGHQSNMEARGWLKNWVLQLPQVGTGD